MDSEVAHATTLTELARSVGERADDLRTSMLAARQRHRLDALCARSRRRRDGLDRARRARASLREQAEIDHETRCSARRLANLPPARTTGTLVR